MQQFVPVSVKAAGLKVVRCADAVPAVSIQGEAERCGDQFHIATRRHVQDTCPKCPADSVGRARQFRVAECVVLVVSSSVLDLFGVAYSVSICTGCAIEIIMCDGGLDRPCDKRTGVLLANRGRGRRGPISDTAHATPSLRCF